MGQGANSVMTELGLTITSSESTATVDRGTGQLLREIAALGTVNVRRPSARVPAGAKSGVGASIGELIVTGLLSTGTIAGIANIIGAYLKRHNGRSVKVKSGDKEITITGQSPDEQLELLRTILVEGNGGEADG
jgi:hypothetical protein